MSVARSICEVATLNHAIQLSLSVKLMRVIHSRSLMPLLMSALIMPLMLLSLSRPLIQPLKLRLDLGLRLSLYAYAAMPVTLYKAMCKSICNKYDYKHKQSDNEVSHIPLQICLFNVPYRPPCHL